MKSTALPSSLADWLARKPAKKVKKRIPAMSEKRKAEHRIYSVTRRSFLSKNWWCGGRVNMCEFMATDVHHTKGRRGGNYLDESTWLPVCRSCHNWIHSHPKEAREIGLLA